MKTLLILSFTTFAFFRCETNAKSNNSELDIAIDDAIEATPAVQIIDTVFDRTKILEVIENKIEKQIPLIVHGYIPLCDNEHQGIVPTSPTLGDGMNLKTNLYWATSGGTKAYFSRQNDWTLVYQDLDIDNNVLERVVFKKQYSNTLVYFIADAYRGDRMEETVNDYLASISGNRHQAVLLSDGTSVPCADQSDLILFNGHNGVMDYIKIKPWINTSEKRTDVVMNACVSYGYLQEEFMLAGGYPLVRSKSLLYPGAYVLEQVINDWVAGVNPVKICLNAGRAYCQKHDCGAGTKVYKTGW